MATLSTLRTEVYSVMGLDSTAAGTDETLVTAWLNEGVRDVLLRTNCYITCATMTLTAGSANYDLDTTVMDMKEAYITGAADSTDYRLQQVSPGEIIEYRVGGGQSTTGNPVSYYAINGGNMLMVYPTPAAADVVNLYYIPRPTEMSSGAHDPGTSTYGLIPVEIQPCIVEYAKWKAAELDDDESSNQGKMHWERYLELVKQAKKIINRKGGTALPPVNVKRRNRRPWARVPSADVW